MLRIARDDDKLLDEEVAEEGVTGAISDRVLFRLAGILASAPVLAFVVAASCWSLEGVIKEAVT